MIRLIFLGFRLGMSLMYLVENSEDGKNWPCFEPRIESTVGIASFCLGEQRCSSKQENQNPGCDFLYRVVA